MRKLKPLLAEFPQAPQGRDSLASVPAEEAVKNRTARKIKVPDFLRGNLCLTYLLSSVTGISPVPGWRPYQSSVLLQGTHKNTKIWKEF